MDATGNDEKIPEVFDPTSINQLLFSIGRLKFSLRALEAVNLQNMLLPPEEIGASSLPNNDPPTESNKILGKIMTDVLTHSHNKEEKSDEQYASSSQSNSPVHKLTIIHDKLQDELEKIRMHHQSVLSEKLKKHKSITSQC